MTPNTDSRRRDRHRTNPFALPPGEMPTAVDWPRWRVVRERTRRDHADNLVLATLALDPTDDGVAP